VSAGVTLAANSTLSMADNTNVTGNVEVGTGANLKFTATKTLTVSGDLILKATETNTENTSFSANIGTGTLAVTGDIKYLKTIDDLRWYFISFPSDVTISTITGNPALGILGTNWFIKYYDGAQRGTSGTSLVNWKAITAADVTATPTLKLNKYQGYIIGLASGSSEITFTLDKTILSTEAANRTVTVDANNGNNAISATNHGWNLIGQPYLSKYATNTGSSMTNIYKFNGSTYTDYHNDAYVQNLPIVDPCAAYFTKVTVAGSLSFGLAARQGVRSSVSASFADVVFLDCTTATGTDRTNIIMDDAQSASYQNGVDYEKMLTTGTAVPQVYTVLGGLNYSYNVLPASSVINLPLAIYTQTTGSTTISVDGSRATSLSKLILTDTGVTPTAVTNLLEQNYTFDAVGGTSNSRFTITAQRITTDNNLIGNQQGGAQLIIDNSQLIINNLSANTSVRVYDALGRMVIRKIANSNVMEINLNARGIYTVQLQNGKTISTSKVIF
ncbi:MAG: T9SS type A sorting domain-containing protein, partial [Paludibacter sp.]